VFDIDPQGRLRYAPFRHYQLPELVRVKEDGTAEFARCDGDTDGDGFGPPMFRRPLYRLRWPGETSNHWEIPLPGFSNLDKIRGLPKPLVKAVTSKWGPGSGGSHADEAEIYLAYAGGAPLSESIAYHIAVNRTPGPFVVTAPCLWGSLTFHSAFEGFRVHSPGMFFFDKGLPRPQVAGLPSNRVDEVLDARFAIDASALKTLTYLRWRAESDYQHPLFQGFDTNIRETLYELQHEAVRMFFYLLADYRYDAKTRWWDRGLDRFVWQRLATYFHWVGRTGAALYAAHSHIDSPGIRQDVVASEMQDVVDADREWLIDDLPAPKGNQI